MTDNAILPVLLALPCFLFVLLFLIILVFRRRDAKKYSFANTQEIIKQFNAELNSVTNERVENAKDDAIAITKRFNEVQERLNWFAGKMEQAEEFVSKLSDVETLVKGTISKNLRRDDMLQQINREVEELKAKSVSNGNERALIEIVSQLEGFDKELNSLDKRYQTLTASITELAEQTEAQIKEIVDVISSNSSKRGKK